jgi:hypothetical protein
MAIIPRYEVEAGNFDPEQIVDLVPELEKSNNAIQASEKNRLNQLIQNSETRIRNNEKIWDQLGTLSKTIQGIAQQRQDKHREDREAVIAFEMLTQGVSPELEAHFKGERDLLFEDSLKAEEFATKYEAETGDSITANDFRNMAGWEKYIVAEQYALQKAKGYDQYVYQAYENEFIEINGVKKYHRDNLNPAEQAALDEKIKFNYARQFAGLNESLVATVVRPEIEKYDANRRKQQAIAREKAYQVQNQESDLRAIESGFVTANPADGYNNAHKFAQRYAARNNTTLAAGRIAFKDNLIGLVKEDKITYPQAMSILYHEEQARDGSMKSMTSWNEWSDLPEDLAEAARLGTQAREQKRENDIAADLQIIRSKDDWTNEEKATMAAVYKDKYDGYVPAELSGALAGHVEDYLAEEQITQRLRYQDGVLYDFQLANVSNEVYNKYSNKIVGTSALTPGTADAKRAAMWIRSYTNKGSGDIIGVEDVGTPEWINLNESLTELFNETYAKTLYKDGVQIAEPETAFQAAKAAVQTAAEDEGTANRMMGGEYDPESDEAKFKLKTVALGQGGGGKWRQNKISASMKDQQQLLMWTKTPLLRTSDIPEHYREVAKRLGISPYDLAQRQASILSDGEAEVKDREVDDIEKKPNRARLIYHYPTRSRLTRAMIDYGYEVNGEEPNVKTSIYNKKALLTPGV